MAINKAVNSGTKSSAGMRNCANYILRQDKTNETLSYMTGPAPEVLTGETVCQAFNDEKKLWGKEDGRLYYHNIISFHRGEITTPSEVLQFGIDFVNKWFPEHQTVIAVHTDKGHLHIHMMTNSVSFVDGHKLHTTKHDLANMKKYTNQMCIDRGLTVAKKGHHFNGEKIEQGEVISWSKDKYNMMRDMTKKSYVSDCAIAVMKTMEAGCFGKDDFIASMLEAGWKTNWSDSRKNISFENENGDKVRDSNISKTFSMDIGKEALLNEFERQNRIKREREHERREQSEYDREIRESINGEGREDTDAFLRGLEAKERAAKEERRNSEVKRAHRDDEQRRLDLERKRTAAKRSRRYHSSLSDSYLGH